jgi:hypothetical protein
VAVVLDLAARRELPRPALADDVSFSFPNANSHAPYRWVGSIDREHLLGDLVDQLRQFGSEVDGRTPSASSRPATTVSSVTPAECVGWMCERPCPVASGRPG